MKNFKLIKNKIMKKKNLKDAMITLTHYIYIFFLVTFPNKHFLNDVHITLLLLHPRFVKKNKKLTFTKNPYTYLL